MKLKNFWKTVRKQSKPAGCSTDNVSGETIVPSAEETMVKAVHAKTGNKSFGSRLDWLKPKILD